MYTYMYTYTYGSFMQGSASLIFACNGFHARKINGSARTFMHPELLVHKINDGGC